MLKFSIGCQNSTLLPTGLSDPWGLHEKFDSLLDILVTLLALSLLILCIYWWCTRNMNNGKGSCMKHIIQFSGLRTKGGIKARPPAFKGQTVLSYKRKTSGPETDRRTRASITFKKIQTDE